MKRFTRLLFFVILITIFGTGFSCAETKPGFPKLYLNDVEVSSDFLISEKAAYLKAADLPLIGAKASAITTESHRILIGNTELRLDLASGIASVYHLESPDFMPIAYTIINYQYRDEVLWLSVKDLAPFLGYRYYRLSDVDLYRLVDGTETITPEVLYEINLVPVIPVKVPVSGPKNEDGKNYSPQKGDKGPANPKKIIYLSFDDGPNKQTKEILRLLKKYNMKATFFLLYNGISLEPNLVKQIKAEGHGIGLHGVTHRISLFYKDDTSPLKEMDRANVALDKVLGTKTKLIRTPYGSKPYLNNKQFEYLNASGYLLWDWNVDSGDSAKSYVSPKIIETRVLTGLKAKAIPVVLLHDKSCTTDSLENILIWMSKNGYVSKPLTEEMTPLNWSK